MEKLTLLPDFSFDLSVNDIWQQGNVNNWGKLIFKDHDHINYITHIVDLYVFVLLYSDLENISGCNLALWEAI